MTHQPFSVFKRKDRPYFLVRYKDELTGKYTSSVNTRQTDKKAAIKTAWEWYKNGLPEKDVPVETFTLLDLAKKTPITKDEAQEIIELLQKRGFIKAAIMTDSKQDVELQTFLLNFWNYDTSPYVRERLRKQHSIHRKYCKTNYDFAKNHWCSFFNGRILDSLTTTDIDVFIEYLDKRAISGTSKNSIIKAGTIAFRWAYQKQIMTHDLFSGIVYFANANKERKILTPEITKMLFSREWNSRHAKLASMLSMCTGLRLGEIRALQIQDFGEDCLYIRHSWGDLDGLKVPKNTESRIVELPFHGLMQELIDLAKDNPHKQGMESFIFWGQLPNKPIDEAMFRNNLKRELYNIGLSETEAKKYTFHSWRHYFTTYMRERVTDKLLQQQTGHKSLSMLQHYSDHRINADKQRLQAAQIEAFGDIMQPVEYQIQEVL